MKYWIQYWADFRNTYNLLYTEDGEPDPKDAERITKAEAIRRCMNADPNDPYRPNAIYPALVEDPVNSGYVLRGHIWKRG